MCIYMFIVSNYDAVFNNLAGDPLKDPPHKGSLCYLLTVIITGQSLNTEGQLCSFFLCFFLQFLLT